MDHPHSDAWPHAGLGAPVVESPRPSATTSRATVVGERPDAPSVTKMTTAYGFPQDTPIKNNERKRPEDHLFEATMETRCRHKRPRTESPQRPHDRGRTEKHVRKPLQPSLHEQLCRIMQMQAPIKSTASTQESPRKSPQPRLFSKPQVSVLLRDSDIPRVLRESPLDDPVTFTRLTQSLPKMYDKVTEIFSNPRLENALTPFREVQVEPCETGDRVEVLDSYVVPFGVEATASAVWQNILAEDECGQIRTSKTVEESEDSLSKTFTIVVNLQRTRGTFRGNIAARRFHDRDRTIIVWSALLDPIEVDEIPVEGAMLLHNRWTVVRRPANTSLSRKLTQVQSRHVIFNSCPQSCTRDLTKVIKFATDAISCHMDLAHQSIENNLLDSQFRLGAR